MALTTDDVIRLCHDGHGVCCCAVYRYQLDLSTYYMCTNFSVLHWNSIGSGKPAQVPQHRVHTGASSLATRTVSLGNQYQIRYHMCYHPGPCCKTAFLRIFLATVFDYVLHGGGVVRLTRAACTGPAILCHQRPVATVYNQARLSSSSPVGVRNLVATITPEDSRRLRARGHR